MRCHHKFANKRTLATVILTLILALSLSGCSQNESVEDLRSSGDVEGLIKKLNSSDSNTKAQAAEALGEIRDERAIKPLIYTLEHSEDSTVREKAAESVASIGNANEALPPLIEALKNDDWRVRYRAAQAIGTLGDPRAGSALVRALDDPVKDVRKNAAWALGEISNKVAVEPLLETVKNDESQEVRFEAEEAIIKLDTKAVNTLIDALEQDDPRVREFTAEALGEIGGSRGTSRDLRLKIAEPLILCFEDKNASVRLATTKALDRIGYSPRNDTEKVWYLVAKREWKNASNMGEMAIEPLINALKGNNSEVKWGATKSLVRIGSPSVETLIKTLSESDNDTRVQAAIALEIIGTPTAKEAVNQFVEEYQADLEYIANNYEEIIKKKDIEGREFLLVLALERYGDNEMVNSFLQNEDPVLRDAAAYWAERHHGNVVEDGTGISDNTSGSGWS
ncbi:MAG: HEAT repeat domain-containing protein [Archaeoglobaceae archaeon]